MDDDSTDGSRALLEARGAPRPARARRRQSRPRPGGRAQRRRRRRPAPPLLARMDADDVSHPERLRAQAARLESDPELTVLGTRVRLFGGTRPNAGHARVRRAGSTACSTTTRSCATSTSSRRSPIPSVMMRAVAPGAPRRLPRLRRARGLRPLAARARGGRAVREAAGGAPRLARRARAALAHGSALRAGAVPRREDPAPGAGPAGAAPAGRGVGRGPRRQGLGEGARPRAGTRWWPSSRCTRAARAAHPRRAGRDRGGGGRAWADALHLAAVGQPGAREEIRRQAARLGLRDGRRPHRRRLVIILVHAPMTSLILGLLLAAPPSPPPPPPRMEKLTRILAVGGPARPHRRREARASSTPTAACGAGPPWPPAASATRPPCPPSSRSSRTPRPRSGR